MKFSQDTQRFNAVHRCNHLRTDSATIQINYTYLKYAKTPQLEHHFIFNGSVNITSSIVARSQRQKLNVWVHSRNGRCSLATGICCSWRLNDPSSAIVFFQGQTSPSSTLGEATTTSRNKVGAYRQIGLCMTRSASARAPTNSRLLHKGYNMHRQLCMTPG